MTRPGADGTGSQTEGDRRLRFQRFFRPFMKLFDIELDSVLLSNKFAAFFDDYISKYSESALLCPRLRRAEGRGSSRLRRTTARQGVGG